MKKASFFSIFIFACFAGLFAQDKSTKFTVTVSTDSILMDNFFEVKFTLENANGQNFEAPDFSDHFEVVSGPNFSSSMSILNGDVNQSMTITYYLEPKATGVFYIQPASVQAEGKVLETSPLEVMVVPNPNGIKQSPPRDGGIESFNFGNPFEFGFPFEQLQPNPPPKQQVPPSGDSNTKKKRKTTRI